MIKKFQNCKNYIIAKAPTWKATVLTFLMVYGPRMVAYADISGTSAENGLKKVLAFLSWGFMWYGIFKIVTSGAQIFSAIQDDEGERAKKHVMQFLIGIVIAANRVILNLILTAIGAGITIPSDPWSA